MALIDANSCECVKSELDLFSVPPTQTSIEESHYEKFYPVTSLSAHGPIEFQLTSSDQDYLDLQNSFLYLKFRILSDNNQIIEPPVDNVTPPSDKSFVLPINYFFATQFKSVEVLLSSTPVSSIDTMYAYRAYIETLLSYGNTQNEQLKCGLFAKDTTEIDIHNKSIADNQCANPGARYRFNETRYSKDVEMWGKIHSEIFCQNKLLINRTDLRVKFHRQNPEFCLMAFIQNARYMVSIDEAILYILHKKISDSVREAHELALVKSPAKYPVRKVEMKFFTRGQGRSDLSEPNLVNGELPRRVVIGIVSSQSFNGSLHHNPLNFKHYNASSIQLRKNGTPLPFEEINVDFNNNLTSRGYLSLFHGTGRLYKDIKMDITPSEYRNGYTLFVFDISQDGCENNASLIKEGNLSLDIKLREALPETAVVIVYLEKEGIIEIDADRNVTYE